MDIKYILEKERNFIDLKDAVEMLSGVEVCHIADCETGEMVIRCATAQDVLALGDRGVYGIRLSVYGGVCALLSS